MVEKVSSSFGMAAPGTVKPSPQAAAAKKASKPRAKPTHPRTAEMVNAAIATLKERGGSSLQAIKKYVAGTYKVDVEKQSSFIKKYLKSAVVSGALIQTKGKGAAGSFKLAAAKSDAAKSKVKPATGKPAALKKAPKKPSPAKKPSGALKKSPAKKPKSIGEKKKVVKGPAAKPPKAKTTKAKIVAKSPPKKAAPIKKAAASKAKKPAPRKTAALKKK